MDASARRDALELWPRQSCGLPAAVVALALRLGPRAAPAPRRGSRSPAPAGSAGASWRSAPARALRGRPWSPRAACPYAKPVISVVTACRCGASRARARTRSTGCAHAWMLGVRRAIRARRRPRGGCWGSGLATSIASLTAVRFASTSVSARPSRRSFISQRVPGRPRRLLGAHLMRTSASFVVSLPKMSMIFTTIA